MSAAWWTPQRGPAGDAFDRGRRPVVRADRGGDGDVHARGGGLGPVGPGRRRRGRHPGHRRPALRAEGLDLLGSDIAPEEALARLRADDPGVEHRQVALIDASGRGVAFTGDGCFACCGHLVGDGYVVAGNMLASDDVAPAMARAFEQRSGPGAGSEPLPERSWPGCACAPGTKPEASAGAASRLPCSWWSAPAGTCRGRGGRGPARRRRRRAPAGPAGGAAAAHRAYEPFHEAVAALMAGDGAAAVEASGRAIVARPHDCSIGFVRTGALFAAGRSDEAVALMTASGPPARAPGALGQRHRQGRPASRGPRSRERPGRRSPPG